MLRNSKYLYGSRDASVPLHLNFGEFLLETFWKNKDVIALINGVTNETTTYGQLAQEATNLAVSLVRLGVRKGEVAAIMCENRPEFYSILAGVICTGAIVTTINHLVGEDEFKRVMLISKPKYLFCSSNTFIINKNMIKSNEMVSKIIIIDDDVSISDALFYKDLATVRHNSKLTDNESSLRNKASNFIDDSSSNKESSYIVTESSSSNKDSSSNIMLTRNYKFEEIEVVAVNGQSDTLFIFYSSGTTGHPKGIMITHLNMFHIFKCQPIQFGDGNIMFTALIYAAGSLFTTLSGFCIKKTFVTLPDYRFHTILEAVKKHKVETLAVLPPFIVTMAKSINDIDLSPVRRVLTGATSISKEIIQKFMQKFPNIQAVLQVYGMTECPGFLKNSYSQMSLQKIASVGKVANNTVIKIVDIDSRKPLGPNQNGEICMKGILMKGYIGMDLQEALDDEGFFITGDVGYYDEDGYIYLVDRLKDLIKYGGVPVYPAELEALLLQHEAVREAGVVGLIDEVASELPLAFVSLQPGKTATEAEIQKFVAKRISNANHLRGGVRFMEELPKNKIGKIDRKLLRAMANK